ncbi:hypothetical protein SAMD00023520_01682 [Listeria monocytogenes]|nr:hypothetical protein SAMD00023520_01682 [Listeria monocytogenes]
MSFVLRLFYPLLCLVALSFFLLLCPLKPPDARVPMILHKQSHLL